VNSSKKVFHPERPWLVSLERRPVKHIICVRGFLSDPEDCTLALKVTTMVRDIGDIADCTCVHSINSFVSNAPMSCSMESSRTVSGVMMVEMDLGGMGGGVGCVWRGASSGAQSGRLSHTWIHRTGQRAFKSFQSLRFRTFCRMFPVEFVGGVMKVAILQRVATIHRGQGP